MANLLIPLIALLAARVDDFASLVSVLSCQGMGKSLVCLMFCVCVKTTIKGQGCTQKYD